MPSIISQFVNYNKFPITLVMNLIVPLLVLKTVGYSSLIVAFMLIS